MELCIGLMQIGKIFFADKTSKGQPEKVYIWEKDHLLTSPLCNITKKGFKYTNIAVFRDFLMNNWPTFSLCQVMWLGSSLQAC